MGERSPESHLTLYILLFRRTIFKPPEDTPQYLVFWLIEVVADLAHLQAFVLSGMREVGGLGFCQA